MKRRVYFVLPFVFLLFSCISNDPIPGQDLQSNIVTNWHLVEVLDDTEVVVSAFELGTVVWKFNTDEEGETTIIITNNNTDMDSEDALDSGTYSYTIVDAPDGDQIFIEVDNTFVEFGQISEAGGQVVIDQRVFVDTEILEPHIYLFEGILGQE